MIAGVDFDHAALAAHQRRDLDERYVRDFGATYVTSGATAGLYATIVKFANGVKVETIEPHKVAEEDFLARFLARSGPGFHHITFVVGDVAAAAETTQAAGRRLLGSRTTFLNEAFVHPKDACGVVVQYIEPRDYGPPIPPADFPVPLLPPARLDHIALVVDSLADGRALFVDLLGGRELGEAASATERWLDVGWATPGTIRLVEPSPNDPRRRWLDGRVGAVHHLAITTSQPERVQHARALGSGLWEVAPEHNWGVRLHLTSPQ